ncbi:MAG: hypothetical protein ACRDO8_02990 [Nocardioidaceae bacterium]
MSLPGANEFFRRTATADADPVTADGTPPVRLVPGDEAADQEIQDTPARRSSGRERHDEKITVYVSADELFDLEQARLVLRRQHRLSVDRGRLVREAIACLLEDFEQQGADGVLVQRLRDR